MHELCCISILIFGSWILRCGRFWQSVLTGKKMYLKRVKNLFANLLLTPWIVHKGVIRIISTKREEFETNMILNVNILHVDDHNYFVMGIEAMLVVLLHFM